MFGLCVDCWNRYLDLGCSISRLYEKDFGFVGFLVKNMLIIGFLMVVYKVMEDFEDLYNLELYLLECKKCVSLDYDFVRK